MNRLSAEGGANDSNEPREEESFVLKGNWNIECFKELWHRRLLKWQGCRSWNHEKQESRQQKNKGLDSMCDTTGPKRELKPETEKIWWKTRNSCDETNKKQVWAITSTLREDHSKQNYMQANTYKCHQILKNKTRLGKLNHRRSHSFCSFSLRDKFAKKKKKRTKSHFKILISPKFL